MRERDRDRDREIDLPAWITNYVNKILLKRQFTIGCVELRKSGRDGEALKRSKMVQTLLF